MKFKVYVLEQGLLTNITVDAASRAQVEMAVLHAYPDVIVRQIVEIKPPKPQTKKVA